LQEAQQQARQLEAEREEAARRAAAAARTEAARVDAERQEAARLAAARQEAARQEAARAEAARREAEREEAARQAAAQQESARQEAARQEAARAEAARVSAAQAAAQRREATLRAIGRQLDEEAARREAAAAAASARPSPNSSGTPRRGRLFGRSDANAELVLYAEAWSRKLQLNMTFDMVREAAQQPHTDPLVTVAIRSDGSVESVSFVRSSGVAALDEAIRRVVQSQANYPAFQPALAREYDVIEIRRTWHFDTAIRLY
jgi:TonB family protein